MRRVSQVPVMGLAMHGGVTALLRGAPPAARDFVPAWMQLAAGARQRVLSGMPVEAAQEACEPEAVRVSLANLMTFPWVAEAVEAGGLTPQGAHFDVANGRLMLLGADGSFAPA